MRKLIKKSNKISSGVLHKEDHSKTRAKSQRPIVRNSGYAENEELCKNLKNKRKGK